MFDVSSPTDALWVGAASLTSSTVEGYVLRARVRNDRAYASTFRKGIQVVDLGRARDNFFAATGGQLFSTGYFSMVQKLNTDGQGFGNDAVVSTTKVETAPGQPARLYDLDVADLSVDGLSQPVVVATGDIGLATVNPQTQHLLFPTPVALGHLDSGGNRLDQGQAVAVGDVVGGPVAVVAGFGRINGTPKALLVVVRVSQPQSARASRLGGAAGGAHRRPAPRRDRGRGHVARRVPGQRPRSAEPDGHQRGHPGSGRNARRRAHERPHLLDGLRHLRRLRSAGRHPLRVTQAADGRTRPARF